MDEMIDMIGDSEIGVRTRKALRTLRNKVPTNPNPNPNPSPNPNSLTPNP